jgi:hypothetical protein
MAVTLNASTTTGLVQSADLSGSLNIQSNGTTVLGVTSTGTSVTGTQSVSGNLSFNSGYGSSAVAYGCRAWVNFNGTTNTGGFCTIRASGNVTTVADNGTGNYTVNFTTAMPDANFCAQVTGGDSTTGAGGQTSSVYSESYTTGTIQVRTFGVVSGSSTSLSAIDFNFVNISIFR